MYNIESIATAARRLKAFADVAGDYGITPGLEFNGFSDVKDIATAVAIVRAAGCGAVALDVPHLLRKGDDRAAVAPNAGDRERFAEGKSVSIRVDIGGALSRNNKN